MRFIDTRTHGVLDYLTGALLIAAPYLFGFATGGPEQWIPIVLGVGLLMVSVLTRYELGLVRMIPMPAHLVLDGLTGLVLVASPFLLGFADRVYLPHVIIGVLEIGASLMTQTTPHDRDVLGSTGSTRHV